MSCTDDLQATLCFSRLTDAKSDCTVCVGLEEALLPKAS